MSNYIIRVKCETTEFYDSQNFVYSGKIQGIHSWSKTSHIGLYVKVQAKRWGYTADISYSTRQLSVESNEWIPLDNKDNVSLNDLNVDDSVVNTVHDCMYNDWLYVEEDTEDPDEIEFMKYYNEHSRDFVLFIGILHNDINYVGDDEPNYRYTAENMISIIVDEAKGEYFDIMVYLFNDKGEELDHDCITHAHYTDKDMWIKDLVSGIKKGNGLTDSDVVMEVID